MKGVSLFSTYPVCTAVESERELFRVSVLEGMRQDCEVLIYIDVEKALAGQAFAIILELAVKPAFRIMNLINFYARKQLLLSAHLSHRNSVHLSVRPSHGWNEIRPRLLG